MIGRPILYRTSKQFLMRFGLSDLDELPSLKEFEQLAQAALGSDAGIAPTEPDEVRPEQGQGTETEVEGQSDLAATSQADAPREVNVAPAFSPASSAGADAHEQSVDATSAESEIESDPARAKGTSA